MAAQPTRRFQCTAFGGPWDQFVEAWAPIIASYVEEALGPYGTEPHPEITAISDGAHMYGVNASYNMGTGHIQLTRALVNNPGRTLEKITHELVHGALSQFPSVDPFYDEGYVDYSTWVLAHGPIYNEYGPATIAAANQNIQYRRNLAMKNTSDYDRKRWAGGLFVQQSMGPDVIHRLRMKKLEGDFTW